MREETLTMIMRREKDCKITLWLDDKHIGYLADIRIFNNRHTGVDENIECYKCILNIKPDYLSNTQDRLMIMNEINEYEIEESKEQKWVEDYGMLPVCSKKNLVRKINRRYFGVISKDSNNGLNITKYDDYYYIEGRIVFDIEVGKTISDHPYKQGKDGQIVCTGGYDGYTGCTCKQ